MLDHSKNEVQQLTHGNRVTETTTIGMVASVYDAANRLRQTVGSTVNNYLLDTASGLSQVLADGINTYLCGLGRISQSSASSKEYYLGDALGSVRQLANASGGIVLSRYYEPYGTIYGAMGSSNTAYGFTGEWTDPYIKLLYLRSRFYSLETGRFLTKDSWQGDYSTPSTLNNWVYTGNNPVNRIDPTGKWYCQTGLIPNHPDCINWVNNALQKLQAGPTGRKVAGYFNTLDSTLNALRGLFECSPLPITIRYPFTLKVIFEPVIPSILGANAFTISPSEIHINSSRPGYSGSVPSPTAVVTFGHEITHLDQLGAEFSVQAEMLSTIVGYYLEEEQGEPHRVDATTIIEGHLNPWNNDDLALYKRSFQLPWPLIIGNGLPHNWLRNWNIILPYEPSDPQRPVT